MDATVERRANEAPAERRPAAPVIDVRGLTKRYRIAQKEPGLAGALKGLVARRHREVVAVDDVSFAIGAGEVVGFLGPNGAGKTTTLKMLAGLLHPTAGTATVLGYVPWRRQPAFQRQFALVMGQKNQLWWDLPAIESFRLNGAVYGVPTAEFRQTLDELVELLGLGPLLDTQVRKLSLGERMKCELAAALLHRPRVLFLDEPTIGLDVVMQEAVRGFVRAYNARHGAAIILTSHYMDDVRELCDRVIIITHGRVLYDGRLATIIARHAPHRVLTVTFTRPVPAAQVAAFGEVAEAEPLRAIVHVPRAEVSARAAALLAELPVADIAIAETGVEEVIRQVFAAAREQR